MPGQRSGHYIILYYSLFILKLLNQESFNKSYDYSMLEAIYFLEKTVLKLKELELDEKPGAKGRRVALTSAKVLQDFIKLSFYKPW